MQLSEKAYLIGSVIFLLLIVVFCLYRLHLVINGAKSIVDDTLKRPDEKGVLRWSRTSLTMFTALILAYYMAIFNLIKNGFNFEIFIALLGVGLGSKMTDAISKRWNPLVQPPKDSTDTTT